MANYPYAQYTETFLEFLDKNPTFLTDTINATTYGNQDYANDMIEILKARFNFYEISGETEDTFKTYFEDTFNQWRKYYLEILKAYNDTWEIKKGIIRTTSSSADSNGNSTGGDTSTYYDLPHKELNDIKKYPDSYTDNTNKQESTSHAERETTITDNSSYLSQKATYINMIRNVHNEFCTRFNECFIHIFD